MTLIVEDGTGLANAESYIAVTDADTYHASRGNDDWASAMNTQKEIALRVATEYMVSLYRLNWKGFRTHDAQALDWPRTYCPKPDLAGGYGGFPNYYLPTDIPTEVKTACADLALRALASDLVPDIEQQPNAVTVGPISLKFGETSSPLTIFPAVSRKLSPFFKGSSVTSPLVRT